MSETNARVVLCTAPNTEVGAQLARGLVEARLAACVNLIPGVRSFYHWEGAIHDDAEVQLVVKTRAALVGEVSAWLEEHHPYDTPEVLALPVSVGSAAYLRWIDASTEG